MGASIDIRCGDVASLTTSTSHRPALVMLENTHSPSMGQPLDGRVQLRSRRRSRASIEVPLHVDGARLFNSGRGTRHAGASAAGRRRQRHVLPLEGPLLSGRVGRGRQYGVHPPSPAGRASSWAAGCARSGVLAAPGLVALSGRSRRHDRASRRRPRQRPTPSGRGPGRISMASSDLDPARHDHQLHRLRRSTATGTGQPLEARGRVHGGDAAHAAWPSSATAGGRVRALTHYGIERSDIERTLHVTREALARLPGLAAVGCLEPSTTGERAERRSHRRRARLRPLIAASVRRLDGGLAGDRHVAGHPPARRPIWPSSQPQSQAGRHGSRATPSSTSSRSSNPEGSR